jgi:proteasome accessory factor A
MVLPKMCGADTELGNFVLGAEGPAGSGEEASRALLREIDGFPKTRLSEAAAPGWRSTVLYPGGYGMPARERSGWSTSWYDWRSYGPAHETSGYIAEAARSVYDRQDWGRKFLRNGGCAYIDLDHLELATPETLSAFDQVAAVHAMLRIAQAALASANASRRDGRRILALANNSDGRGHSYGSHVNLLLSRATWDNIFCRRLQLQLALAAFQASSIVFTGQGKVGSENGAPPVEFQISQRADFIETLSGIQTTYRRPIVNSRDEPLCGCRRTTGGDPEAEEMARLHVIFFDNTLCHVSTLLKFGTMQIVLAMIEAGRFNAGLILDDPLEAVIGWSHDPALETRAVMADGRHLTAVDLQWLFFDDARRFVDSGGCEGAVPRAPEIMALWEKVLSRLEARDLDALTGQLDWVLKWSALGRAMEQRPELTWRSPEIKHLDLLYSSLDPEEGLYWAYEREGAIERLAVEEEIQRLTTSPPEDTRAWTRGTLLGLAGADGIEDADWDRLKITTGSERGWRMPRVVHLENPLKWTSAAMRPVFEADGGLEGVLDRLERLQDSGPGALVPASRAGDIRRVN